MPIEAQRAPEAPATDQTGDKRDALKIYESMIIDVRSRRLPIDDLWLRFHAAYLAQATRQQYNGVFTHYIPAARRALNRAVTRLVEMLTPSNQFFEVYPLDEYGEQAGQKAESVWRFLLYLTTKKIAMGSLLRQLGRTFYLYARCISKFGVRLESTGPGSQPFVWPTLRAVDPFCFYAWPETTNSLDECTVIFEDVFMPYTTYDEIAKMPAAKTEKLDDTKLTAPTWPSSYTARLARKTLTEPSATQQGRGEDDAKVKQPVRFVELTELWTREDGQWMMRWIAWNYTGGPRIVRQQASPFGRHPYRWALSNSLPGEQANVGMMDDLEPMQIALNDQVNMTMEGQAVAISPPVAVDPNLVSRPNSIVFKPRARWFMDPNGAKVLEVPDTTKSGILGVNMFLGFIDSFSGSNPLAEGQPTRGMPRAGFAVSSLLNLSLADIRDAARLIEDEVLTPSLGDLYRLAAAFLPTDQLMSIPGTQGFALTKVRKQDIVGDWEFAWVGSQQAQDYQVRSQRLMAAVAMLIKGLPVLQPALDRSGMTVDWPNILKRVWRDGLGERGADSLIRKLTPQEQQMMMMQMIATMQQNAQQQGAPGPAGMGTGVPSPGSNEGMETTAGRQLSQGATAGPQSATTV